MNVIIANFGRENYLWPACLRKNSVATLEDVRLRPYFLAGDRDGYISFCLSKMRTVTGRSPTRPVASRWFNIGREIAETVGDLWIHREGADIWWTITLNEPAIAELGQSHIPEVEGPNVWEIHKPAHVWKNKNRKGAPLKWQGLHPKAKTFIFTESTLVRFSEDNANYVKALINGEDLSPWHNRSEWRAKLASATQAPVSFLTPMQMASLRMASTAMAAAAGANGQLVEVKKKEKNFLFGSEQELQEYILMLISEQNSYCALTGLPLQFDGALDDVEMLASLDRKDSAGHYAPDNLQVVCRFANRWKSSDSDDNFVRLLSILRSADITER